MHSAIMVMGVSGCGKSTVGAGLAEALGGMFLDGDDYHPQINVDHMAAGQPLTDDMRWPWLDILASAVNAARVDQVTVFACSALKKSYRDHLRANIPNLKVAHLDAPHDVVAGRIAARDHQYMPTSLLDSQYTTLETPQNADAVVRIDQPLRDIVSSLKRLG